MITPLLQSALEPVLKRQLRTRRMFAQALSLLIGSALYALLARSGHAHWWTTLLIIAATIPLRRFLTRRHSAPDFLALARLIESRHPDLHALLLTAVEQRPDPATHRLDFLQQKVISDAVAACRRLDLLTTVPAWKLFSARFSAGLAFLLFVFLLLRFPNRPHAPTPGVPTAAAAVPQNENILIEPGNVSVERGADLVILAKFKAPVPNSATLLFEPASNPPDPALAQKLPLTKNLQDPVFGGNLANIQSPLRYRVEYGDQTSSSFTIEVFEYPKLERTDATLHFPQYTQLADKAIPDTRRVSAVEGSKVELRMLLNKPVRSASLIGKDGSKIPLILEPGKPIASLHDFTLQNSQTYELKLEDEEGRVNKLSNPLVFEALPNRRPELKFQSPRGDQRFSALEEITFRGQAWDDFGLTRYGLTLKVADQAPQDLELGAATKPDEHRSLSHLLKLEELGVKPDELLSWSLWAEDIGPDGKPRRTVTDLYFGEIRPFEEIYRNGEPGEGKGKGNQAAELADLQKKVLNATWNLKRNQDSAPAADQPTPQYLKDLPVVRDSQEAALAQAKTLIETLEDPKTKALAEQVPKEMARALEHLTKAQASPTPLPEALQAEHAAYNALLKLAAHEFKISRSKSSESKSESQRNAQLDQLELKPDPQRYENKKEAEAPEEQRAQLAMLNRLKELAQRQKDINSQLKELQTALQAAQSEPEKEEIRRQLKRLREEEQQLLADLDELKQKVEQSPQAAQLADERRQLEQSRSEAQKTAEALEKGQTSQALASGSRTQEQLQEMRDSLRKKTGGQFKDQMRDLRQEARSLSDKQQELSQALQKSAEPAVQRSLESNNSSQELAKNFQQQQAGLNQLTEKIKTLSEQAEGAEPVLAKELYETLRKAAQSDTGRNLEVGQMLVKRGLSKQAQPFGEKARAQIDELKDGVEQAAQSVLGDEAEALRQARAELETLATQLDRELARARPDLAQTSPQPSPARPPEPDGQPGDKPSNSPGSQPADKPSNSPGSQPGDQPSNSPGSQPGDKPSNSPGSQPGDKPSNAPGSQPGDKPSNAPGSQPGNKPSSSPGSQPGDKPSNSSGSQPGDKPSNSPGSQPGGPKSQQTAKGPRSLTGANSEGRSASTQGGPTDGEQAGPLTGSGFSDWSDRLRNVEEMIDDPTLRNEAARIRDLAKGFRVEFKRHSVDPNWEMVHRQIRAPLVELRQRLSEELARRESKENLVPIDRDPVPTKYAERVRRYYEELGRP